jgi:hypothetical protein
MVNAANNLQFELSTGILYADQAYVDRVEDGKAPRNLIQLLAMGKLLVGATTELGQEDAGNGLIVPLPEILRSEQYEGLDTSPYGRLDVSDWDMDNYVDYGRWLDGLTKDPRQAKTGLSREVITRAYHIGVGPSVGRIEHRERFGNITRYYHACEVLPTRGLYKYDGWDSQQLADYAEKVFLDLKSQAESRGEVQSGYQLKLNEEIERRAHLGLGPALWIFKRNEGGGVMRFMALNGYADPKNMAPEDYKRLGIRFMRANGGRLPTPSAIDFLALSRRAPTSHDVWTKFTTWDDYLGQIQAAYYEAQTFDQKLLVIKRELKDGTLPPFIIREGAPVMENITRRAKWRVVNELLPNLNPGYQQTIAEHESVSSFVMAIRFDSHSNFNTADIEEAAKKLNVYEDIWPEPEDAYMDYLRVPVELLERGSTAYLANVVKGRRMEYACKTRE